MTPAPISNARNPPPLLVSPIVGISTDVSKSGFVLRSHAESAMSALALRATRYASSEFERPVARRTREIGGQVVEMGA